jgi:hypothetical protein
LLQKGDLHTQNVDPLRKQNPENQNIVSVFKGTLNTETVSERLLKA